MDFFSLDFYVLERNTINMKMKLFDMYLEFMMTDLYDEIVKDIREEYRRNSNFKFNSHKEEGFVKWQLTEYSLVSTDQHSIADGIDTAILSRGLTTETLFKVLHNLDLGKQDLMHTINLWKSTYGGSWMDDVLKHIEITPEELYN